MPINYANEIQFIKIPMTFCKFPGILFNNSLLKCSD